MNRPKTLSGKGFLLATRGLLAGALAVAALGLAAAPAAAATVTVNTTVDQEIGGCPADCSLRDAAAFAAPGDTILIPPGHYVLTLGQISLTKNLILHGGGQLTFGARFTTIDGNGSSRLFFIAFGPSVELSDLSLVNGNAIPAGAVWVLQGTATFRRCTFAGNQSFAEGGAIFSAISNLTIEDSTFSDNHSNAGGAISGTLSQISIVNSTFSGNTATDGGALILSSSTATLVNNTVTANQGTAAITSFDSTLSLSNTIVAGNLGPDCSLSGGTLASDHNLDGDGSCGFNGPGDLSAVDPLLGPLANNGGGTDTHALAAGSPAIDAGNDAACPATDQRSLARPQGAACDIGAYELLAQPTPQKLIGEVIAFIESLDLQNGIENALVSKLANVLDKLDQGNTGAAINELQAFINQVKAQRGKKIPADTADLLVEAAEAIIEIIRG